jgi:hypothetical protein
MILFAKRRVSKGRHKSVALSTTVCCLWCGKTTNSSSISIPSREKRTIFPYKEENSIRAFLPPSSAGKPPIRNSSFSRYSVIGHQLIQKLGMLAFFCASLADENAKSV